MTDASADPAEFVRRLIADPPERVNLDPGLTDIELEAIENRFRFVFPPDLRALLSAALPVSPGFPDWRSALDDDEDLETALDWPAEGICFDVERNGFWLKTWGARPLDSDEAGGIARERIADAPTLIPVYGRRYLPEHPAAAGNPVLAVHQSDIVHAGRDLPDYLDREFGPPAEHAAVSGARRVPFWSDLLA